ncbi:MAG: tRNA (guanosine(37)-N1)-methyltransferase TrmD [Candidatus Eisenbacteria sp.]|nr:tRNA (guanosine(37)-N1)-methyltransferase TrmD [Candidatus Eisenbacteria bacterium]
MTVLTGFPALFGSLDAEGIIKIAIESGLAEVRIVNLRDYTDDRHRTIDDRPYGGGPGMILKIAPVARALEALPPARARREVILLSPQGERLQQGFFEARAAGADLVLICGRYKGVDERIRTLVDREISLGDFVISGGELAAMILVDGLLRLIPGVLGDLDSARGDSFSTRLLDCAYYTRPETWRGCKVPEVLLSGHHAEIRRWRRQDVLRRTRARRPDLLLNARLEDEDRRHLASLDEAGSES